MAAITKLNFGMGSGGGKICFYFLTVNQDVPGKEVIAVKRARNAVGSKCAKSCYTFVVSWLEILI